MHKIGLDVVGAVSLVVEYQNHNWQIADSPFTSSTASNLEQAAMCCVLRKTQPPTLIGTESEKWGVAYLLWATGWRPSAADCSGYVSN